MNTVDQNPSPRLKAMTFDYAIIHEDLGYFKGTSHTVWKDNFSKERRDAYTYTEHGAHTKIGNFPHAFKGCTVKHV